MPDRVEVVFVDPNQDDYVDQIKAVQPGAVLMDALDAQTTQCCLLCELLLAFPDITLVRLTVDQTEVQVVTSQKRCFPEVQNLIDVLAPP